MTLKEVIGTVRKAANFKSNEVCRILLIQQQPKKPIKLTKEQTEQTDKQTNRQAKPRRPFSESLLGATARSRGFSLGNIVV